MYTMVLLFSVYKAINLFQILFPKRGKSEENFKN